MVNDALSELFPMIDVETLNTELLRLSGWRTCFGASQLLASVGELNHHQLFNPVGSGMIMVPTRIDMRISSTADFRYATSAIALTDFTANRSFRDTRGDLSGTPVGQPRSVQQVGGIALVGIFRVIADITSTIQNDSGLFTLAPGTGITFATGTNNLVSQISWFWKERVAEPAELNF